MGKIKYVTTTEFATEVGVSAQRIYKVLSKKRLSFKTIKGRKMIALESGKKEWEANKLQHSRNPSGKAKGEKTKTIVKKVVPDKYLGMTTMDAERKDKYFKAKLSELKYEEQAGKLLSAEKVEREAFETGRKTRDAILSVPGRIAHELAAITDPHKLEIRLTKELQSALEKIAKAGGA